MQTLFELAPVHQAGQRVVAGLKHQLRRRLLDARLQRPPGLCRMLGHFVEPRFEHAQLTTRIRLYPCRPLPGRDRAYRANQTLQGMHDLPRQQCRQQAHDEKHQKQCQQSMHQQDLAPLTDRLLIQFDEYLANDLACIGSNKTRQIQRRHAVIGTAHDGSCKSQPLRVVGHQDRACDRLLQQICRQGNPAAGGQRASPGIDDEHPLDPWLCSGCPRQPLHAVTLPGDDGVFADRRQVAHDGHPLALNLLFQHIQAGQ